MGKAVSSLSNFGWRNIGFLQPEQHFAWNRVPSQPKGSRKSWHSRMYRSFSDLHRVLCYHIAWRHIQQPQHWNTERPYLQSWKPIFKHVRLISRSRTDCCISQFVQVWKSLRQQPGSVDHPITFQAVSDRSCWNMCCQLPHFELTGQVQEGDKKLVEAEQLVGGKLHHNISFRIAKDQVTILQIWT